MYAQTADLSMADMSLTHRTLAHDRRIHVNEHAFLRLRLAQHHRRRDLAAAANARLLRAHRAKSAGSIRARIGRSIIRLGERLASESPLEPARPR